MAAHLTIAFVALLPIYLLRFRIGPLPTTALEALWIVVMIAWLMRWRSVMGDRKNRPYARIRPWLMPCGLLLAAGIIGVVVAPDTRAALGLLRAYLVEPVLFFLVFQAVADDALRKRAAVALVVSGTVVALIALLQPLVAPHTLWEGVRATSVYSFPNAVGLFLAPIVVLAAGMVFGRGRKFSAATAGYAIAAVLMFAALVAAQSEGAVVGVAAGLLALGLLHAKARKPTMIVAIAAIALILVIPPARHFAAEKLLLRDWSGTVRRITWEETVHMLRDRPLTGAGLSGYPILMRAYHKATAIEIFQYPHNVVLNIWSELGLLGLAAFGWILVTFFRLAGRDESRPYGRIAIAAMIALLVHGLVDVPYFKNDLAFLFWIIVALGTAGALPKSKKQLA